MHRPLQVEDIGERLRFHVRSETSPKTTFYLVDLSLNEQWGWCNCKHHQTRLQPSLTRGHILEGKLRCKHVQAARDYVAGLFVSAVCLRYPDESQG